MAPESPDYIVKKTRLFLSLPALVLIAGALSQVNGADAPGLAQAAAAEAAPAAAAATSAAFQGAGAGAE